jgi:hypothetical protein
MEKEKLVSVTVSLPQKYRDLLRRLSAEQNLKNPERFTGISQLAREIICERLDRIQIPKKGGAKNG